MNIIIFRHRHTRYGIDGILSINGRPVCCTCEHPQHYIPPGEYDVTIARNKKLRRKVPYLTPKSDDPTARRVLKGAPFIRIGNGPFKLRDGSIIIGKCHLAGVVIRSAECFNRLIDRLDKASSRGISITLTIQ